MTDIVFLIDDDSTYNALNKRMLRKQFRDKYEIKDFTNAEEALKEIMENNIIPEYIFLDVNMPMMDGWEFLQKLEKEAEANPIKTKISMLTSSIYPGDKEKALKYKLVTHFINKPLDPVSMKTIFD